MGKLFNIYRRIGLAACFAILTAAVQCRAGSETVASGPWTLTFDTSNGYWQTLKWRDKVVSDNTARLAPFNWGPEWPGGKIRQADLFRHNADWIPSWPAAKGAAPYRLEKYQWNKADSTLKMDYRINDWKIRETIAFGVPGCPDLLARTLQLTYTPVGEITEPAVIANVVFNTPVVKKGRYFFPAKRNPALNTGPSELAQLSKNGRVEAHWCTILPVLLEQDGSRTAIFLPDGRQDLTNVQILTDDKTACIQSNFKSYGWAYPGEPQTVGPAYLKMTPDKLETALTGGIWTLYDEAGLKTPSQRPDWLRDAVLYAFHPGGGADSGWRDLGGFRAAREELLPRLKTLGINTIWVLPIEDESVYHPRDYYRIDAKLGTAEEYRAMVDAAHADGMKVWQDIVPHGGRPEWGIARGNKPWELAFDKNGDALNYWCFDFANPSWQRYVAEVAAYYMKNFKLDGFRMDAPDGSHIPNWRKKDFPSLARTPKNVPEEWWRTELQKNGGKLPPMPFARASVCRRQGGLEMINGIRNAVKAVNPNGGVLGEICGVPYSTAADLVYDKEFCYYFLRDLMLNASSEEFTQGLSRWLEQQKYAEIRDTVRMRYIESHDSFHTNHYLGVGATQAVMALTIFIDGVPMIYQDADIGMGVFLKKAIAIRAALPEFRRGEAYYLATEAEPKSVFSCLRVLGRDTGLALINLSPVGVEAKMSVPVRFMPPGEVSAWDCWNGRRMGSGTAEKIRHLTVKLGPWETSVVAFRPSSEPCPVAAEPVAPPPKVVRPTINAAGNSWGTIAVNTPYYSLRMKKTGDMTMTLPGNPDNAVLSGPAFIFDSALNQDSAQLPVNGSPRLEKTASGYRIESSANLPVGGKVSLTYRCMPGKLEIDAVLEGSPEVRRVGIAFSSKSVKRWQVNSAEGLIDDLFAVRHAYGTPGQNWGRAYRMQGTPVVWQSRTNPLDLNRPLIGIFPEKGEGLIMEVKNPLRAGLDNIMVLDKINKDCGWNAAFFWRDRESRQPKSGPATSGFTMVLKPREQPLQPTKREQPFLLNGLAIRNDSLGWQIDNPYYRLTLPRIGGYIKSLRNSNGVELLGRSYLYADSGFAPKNRDVAFAAQSNDIEAGVKLWQEDKKLKMLFTGILKGGKTASYDVMPLPPIRFFTLYTFDGASPSFDVQWGLLCEGTPGYGNPSLGWQAMFPTAGKVELRRDGKNIAVGNLTRKERTGETARLPGGILPDTIRQVGRDGKPLFELEKLSGCLRNVFVSDGKVQMMWFDHEKADVRSGQWLEAAATIKVLSEK